MKKSILILALSVLSVLCYSQNDRGVGRASKIQGVEVYVMSEPLHSYTVTGKVTKDDIGSFLNAFAGKKDERTIKEMLETLVENANRKQKKGKLDFDAILTEDGKTGTLIKYKD